MELFHPTDIQQILQDERLMAKFEDFTLRRHLANEPDCRWCPAPDCGLVVAHPWSCLILDRLSFERKQGDKRRLCLFFILSISAIKSRSSRCNWCSCWYFFSLDLLWLRPDVPLALELSVSVKAVIFHFAIIANKSGIQRPPATRRGTWGDVLLVRLAKRL